MLAVAGEDHTAITSFLVKFTGMELFRLYDTYSQTIAPFLQRLTVYFQGDSV